MQPRLCCSQNHKNSCYTHTYTYNTYGEVIASGDTALTYDPLNRLITINDDALLYNHDLDIGTYRNGEPLHLRILGNTLLIELERTYILRHDLFGNINPFYWDRFRHFTTQ